MELPTFTNKTLLTNKPNDKSKKLNINLIVSSLVITCIIMSLFTIPKQPSKADHIINRISNSVSWTKSVQINTWITNIMTTKPVVRKTTPIIMNNIWGWESEKTNQGWTKFVLDCDKIVLHTELATKLSIRACKRNPEKKMLASFNQESWYNPYARWAAWEYWICQMMPNKTNIVWINDPRWNDPERQMDRCVDKWLAVPVQNRDLIWSSAWSNAYMKYLYLFDV